MATGESAQEKLDRYKVLPSFALDFHEKPAEEQIRFYQLAGIRDPVHKKLFEFLCSTIQDALSRTKRALTTYRYFFDVVLKWSSNPNNLRLLPGFPKGVETLKNNFDPLLRLLIERGIVVVEPDMEAPDEEKSISFALETSIKTDGGHRDLALVTRILNAEYEKARRNPLHPLPLRKQVEAAMKKPLGAELRVERCAAEDFRRDEVRKDKYAHADLVELDFRGQAQLLLTPEQFLALRDLVGRRTGHALETLPSPDDIDAYLKERFPAEPELSVKFLLADRKGDEILFDKRLAVWTALLHRMLGLLKSKELAGPGGPVKRFSLYLLLAWLLAERKLESEAGEEREVLDDLWAHVKGFKRYMTRVELHERDKARAYARAHSEEKLTEVFNTFVKDHLLEHDHPPAESLLRTTGPVLGVTYLYAPYALDLLQEIPAAMRRTLGDVLEKHFTLPLVDNLYRDHADRETLALAESDDAMEERLRTVLLDHYRQLSELHFFIDLYDALAANPEWVARLAAHAGIPPHQFLVPDGATGSALRPLLVLLRCSRQEVMRAAEHRVPLLRKFFHALRGLFGGGKKQAGRPAKAPAAKKKPTAKEKVAREARGGDAPRKGAHGTAHGSHGAHDASAGAGGGKKGAPAASRKPKDARALSPEEQHGLLAKGKTIEEYLAIWNRHLGDVAAENKRIVDGVIEEKLGALKRKLKAGDTALNVEEQAMYVTNSPRLAQVQKRDALYGYVTLYLFQSLEEYRKANRINVEYFTLDGAKKKG